MFSGYRDASMESHPGLQMGPGGSPRFSRANLDGSNAVILVQGDAGWHSLVGIGTRGGFYLLGGVRRKQDRSIES